jgi:rRNA maturation RNase YbeY
MIEFQYLIDFELVNTVKYTRWLNALVAAEGKLTGEVTYIFTHDEYVRRLNSQYLNHDYYTDILTFDNSSGNLLEGDIYISIDRVRENCEKFSESFNLELLRVMAHGLLHMMGYNDKTEAQIMAMKEKEEWAITMFHVEQKLEQHDRDQI